MITTTKIGMVGAHASQESTPPTFEMRVYSWLPGQPQSICRMYYLATQDEAFNTGNYLASWYQQRGICCYIIDARVWFNGQYHCLPGYYIWEPCGQPPPASPNCLTVCSGMG
jgi:hypothetical protein